MDRARLLVAFIVLAGVSDISIAQQMDSCDPILVQQYSSTSSRNSSLYAWLKLIDRTTYDEAKHDAQGQAYSYLFSGSYDDFTKQMSSYHSTDSGVVTQSDAREAFKSYLSPEQVAAWRDCKLGTLQLIASYDKVDSTGATLNVIWSPPGQLAQEIGPLTITRVELNDGSHAPNLKKGVVINGPAFFLLTRPTSGGVIKGTIEGVTQRARTPYSAAFYIPAITNPTVTVEPQRGYVDQNGLVVTSFAFWNGGTANRPFECITPPSGKTLIVASTTDVNRGMNRQGRSKGAPGCVPWAQHWCQTTGEFCVDRHISEGCIVNDDWLSWYKQREDSAGLPYSKAAACEAAAR